MGEWTQVKSQSTLGPTFGNEQNQTEE